MTEIPEAVQERLTAHDDPQLWIEVLRAAADDALYLQTELGHGLKLYAIVGACSHWFRPHQTRWTAGGGFAAPIGYGPGKLYRRGQPELDWSVILQFDFDGQLWSTPERPPPKNFRSVRLAIPTRTTRHAQAAIHVEWSPGTYRAKTKRIDFYGFRKLAEGDSGAAWSLVAHSKPRGEAPNATP